MDYYDITSHNSNQVTARENETKKKRLSLSHNLAVVFEKNDIYSMKAITSKRLINYKKNFVDINRKKYLNSGLQTINEIPDIISKKNSKNKLNQKKKLQIRLNTYNTFNKVKNANKIKKKYFSFITQTSNNENNKDSHKDKYKIPNIKKDFLININKQGKINRKSNLFLTQNNFNNRSKD